MVTRVFRFLYSEIRGLHQAAYILALFAVGSQVLALVRDRLLAHNFGAGSELDLYYAAFRLPDLLFALFGSVLSVYVLLPFVAKAQTTADGERAGARILGQMFTLFVIVYTAVTVVLFIMMPTLVLWLFPGMTEQADLLTLLIRILLLQPLLLGLSGLYGVVTQLSKRFVLYAVSPLVYNLGIIFGIVMFYPLFGLTGLVLGVLLGAAGHLLIQVPLMRRSPLSFAFFQKIDWQMMREILMFAIPRAITLSIHQVVLLVLIGMATVMAVGSVAVFQFAFNLQSVPLAIIGMSYSVAAFPVLSQLFARQDRDAFCTHLIIAFRHILFWSLPIIALVVVLRAHIVRVVLGSGEFGWSDTRLTAAMLAMFVISLVAQSMLLLLIRAFYAGGNTKIPLLAALFGGTVAIGGAYLLNIWYATSLPLQNFVSQVFRLEGVTGVEVLMLALAFAFGVIVEMILLLYFATRNFGVSWQLVVVQLRNALLAAVVAGVTAYATLAFIVDGIKQDTFMGIALQGGIAGLFGLIGAWLTYHLLKSAELQEITTALRAKLFKTNVIGPQSDNP